eukprot:14753979-Alexandrium_andersonii.AAC.1
MSARLVGSEMCIRDRPSPHRGVLTVAHIVSSRWAPPLEKRPKHAPRLARQPVSSSPLDPAHNKGTEPPG